MTTSDTPHPDYLKHEVALLKQLLDDPHPGLISWCDAYGRQMQKISDFWNVPQAAEETP